MEEEKKEQSEKKNYQEKLLCDTEKIIEQILEDGIQLNNLDYLGKVVDIHKDICEEMYRKERLDIMRYNNYSNYSGYGEDSYSRRGVAGTGRGRYRNDSYSKRGVPGSGRGRYSGHEMIDDMAENYSNYSEDKMRYGADESTIKSLDEMLKSVEDFMEHLEENAESEQEVSMIKKTAKRIAKM